MQSWREVAPQSVQDTFDGLYSMGVDAAESMLAKNKEFFPFGLQTTGGEAQMIGADPGLGEQPPSQAVLDSLYDVCRSRRDSLDAVAFVSDVRLQSGGDAIRVDLEHKDGHALEILLSYRLKKLRGGIDLGERSVAEGARRIWQ